MSPHSSSDSDSSDGSSNKWKEKKKDKKSKKEHKVKHKDKDMYNDNYGGFGDLPTSPSFPNPHGGSSHHGAPSFPSFPSHSGNHPGYGEHDKQPAYPSHGDHTKAVPPVPPVAAALVPPSAPSSAPPPSGYRIPLDTSQPFPSAHQLGPPPCADAGGEPIYIGSAIFTNPNAVHPCKIGPHLVPTPCAVPFGGQEYPHAGRYDLLPFDPQTMEWVRTSNGRIPQGRRPIQGGYEADGSKLYHAKADIASVLVPGKVGEHLGGATVPFGCQEHKVTDNYEILCWRY